MAAAQSANTTEPTLQSVNRAAADAPANVTVLNPQPPIVPASSSEAASAVEKSSVKQIVDEIVELMGEIHEAKEELIARGITFHMINAMVGLGVRNKVDELAVMRDTALQTSKKQYGGAAITAKKFDEHLTNLVAFEKQLGKARQIGREQGLDMASINYLILMIRQNPGDGGERMINTFFAYAMACDIAKDEITQMLTDLSGDPAADLLETAEDDIVDESAAARKRLITDICIGCALALLTLTVLT